MNDSLSCKYFSKHMCRSCTFLDLGRNLYESEKEQIVLEAIAPFANNIGHFESLLVPKRILPSRAKAKLSVSGSSSEPVVGLLDKDFSGIELLNCPLHLPSINKIITALPALIEKFDLMPYDIQSRQGELKGVIVNSSSDESEVMLRFVLKSSSLISRLKKAIPELQMTFPFLKVISANIQPIPHQILEGEHEETLTEDSIIWDRYSDVRWCFTGKCFTQVTPEIAEELYKYVGGLIAQTKAELVLDLFCGVGGFALFAAQHARKVIGVELSEASIACAKRSAIENEMSNVEFYSSDSREYISQLMTDDKMPDVVICNPPRRGLSSSIISNLISFQPETIIYSSCNPETLARDLSLLSDCYSIDSVKPFDMFPYTRHIELVTCLKSKGSV